MKKNVVKLNETQLRSLIKESVKKVLREMDELSPEYLIKAKKAFQDKYGETGRRDNDWIKFVDRERYEKGRGYNDIFAQKDEWNKRREENGLKSDPGDLKTYKLKKNGEKDYISGHISNFDSAISNAMHSPEYSDYLDKLTSGLDPLTAAAVKVYYPGDLDWDSADMTDNYEHGYGEFGDSAEVYDDEGNKWEFYRDYQGHDDGGGSIEIDDLEDITFVSPDGQTGSIPSKFWYPEY